MLEEGAYRVKTSKNEFSFDIMQYDIYYSIRFGDPYNREEGPCIEIQYNTERNEANIESLVYDRRCGSSRSLERGEGTRDMVMASLKVLATLFAGLTNVYFKDASQISCENNSLYLSYYYVAMHGQTWYERYFNAKPRKKKLYNKLKAFKELLSSKPSLDTFSFYKNLTNHETWNTYFREKSCSFFLQHFNEIVNVSRVNLVYSEWRISRRSIDSYNVSLSSIKKKKTPLVRGGKQQLLASEDL